VLSLAPLCFSSSLTSQCALQHLCFNLNWPLCEPRGGDFLGRWSFSLCPSHFLQESYQLGSSAPSWASASGSLLPSPAFWPLCLSWSWLLNAIGIGTQFHRLDVPRCLEVFGRLQVLGEPESNWAAMRHWIVWLSPKKGDDRADLKPGLCPPEEHQSLVYWRPGVAYRPQNRERIIFILDLSYYPRQLVCPVFLFSCKGEWN
jgi:hypothetical protein